MGGGGGSSAAAKSGATKTLDTEQISASPLTATNIKSMLFPALERNSKDIESAEKTRKAVVRNLLHYATSRDSDGNPIDKIKTEKYTIGTKKEIKKYVEQRARDMTFGNQDLYPQKYQSELQRQRDMVSRQKRLVELANSPNFKSAKWWNSLANRVLTENAAKEFIDGKINERTKHYFGK